MEIIKIIRKGKVGECVYKHDNEHHVYRFNASFSDKDIKNALQAMCKNNNKKTTNKPTKEKTKIQDGKEVKK